MAATRLPQVGADDGEWGQILNDFLAVEHNTDGSLKLGTTISQAASDASNALTTANGKYTKPAGGIPETDLALAVQTKLNSGASVTDATTTTKGVVQLAGDLGGTAAAPTVPGLAGKYTLPGSGIPKSDLAASVQASLTTADARDAVKLQGRDVDGSAPSDGQVLVYSTATSAWVPNTASTTVVTDATTGAKGIVQLAGDLAGTASAPTVPGLAAKAADSAVVHNTGAESIAGVKTFTSSPVVPTPTTTTAAANKSYVDTAVSGVTTADATTTTKGVVQLAGDLAGTATAPSVAKVKGVAISVTAPTTGQVLTATGATSASWQTPSTGSSTLAGATDVTITTPANNDFLIYNSSTSKWNNLTLTGRAALPTGGGVETLSALGTKTGATAINLANGNVFSVTLTGNVSFSFSGATAATACSFGLYVKQDGTGGRTVTWPVSVKWAGGVAPSLSMAANALDVLVFETLDGGTTWYGSLVGLAFA